MTSRPVIKFGTDGWRAVISDTFTFENVRAVSQAVAEYMHSAHYERRCVPGRGSKKLSKRVVVGYDTRFLSDRYAAAVAEVLAANGYQVLLTKGPTPTPCVCHAIQRLRLRGGVVITASHNPPEYNGFKFRPAYAGASDSQMTRQIERRLFRGRVRTVPLQVALARRQIRWHDEVPNYVRFLKRYVDTKTLRKKRLRILVDSMHGVGGRLIERILTGAGHHVDTLHADANTLFGGVPPEPIDKHLGELKAKVRRGRYHLGLATDGDADRIGAVDAKGRFVSTQWLFPMVLLHLVKNRRLVGGVVRSISSTMLLDRISEKYGLELYEVPVGFKYIAEKMRTEDILMGGEESGGLTFRDTVPEKDGILSALLIVEMMCAWRKGLAGIQRDLLREYGPYYSDRYDWHFTDLRVRARLRRLMQGPPRNVAGRKVVRAQTTDGLKLIFKDSSWVLLRPSGTEPTLRVYAEAPTPARVRALLSAGIRLARNGV